MCLESLTQGTLVSGRRNIENRVRSISVLDAVNGKEAESLKGIKEQILLTSFKHVKKEAEKENIIKVLSKKGAAALVVFNHQKGTSQISKKLAGFSENVGFPLIDIPAESPSNYSNVIEEVMDKLLYGTNFKNGLINNTIYHILDFERHSSFQSALKEAALSNEFQVVMLSRDFNPILTVETRQKTTVADAIRLGKEKNVEKEGVYTFIDVNGVLTYWGPITVDGERYFLMIVDNEDNYSAGEITKLAEIIELAVGMWKYTPKRDVRAELIKALIRGNKSLAYSLKDEMELVAENIMSVFYAKGIENSKSNGIISDFEKSNDIEIIRLEIGRAHV